VFALVSQPRYEASAEVRGLISRSPLFPTTAAAEPVSECMYFITQDDSFVIICREGDFVACRVGSVSGKRSFNTLLKSISYIKNFLPDKSALAK